MLPSIDDLLRQAIEDGAFPGCAYAVGSSNGYSVGYLGRHTYDPASPLVNPRTRYDLASITKVMFTTEWAMELVRGGKLNLECAVRDVIPELACDPEGKITIKMLLDHSSGIAAHRMLWRDEPTPKRAYLNVAQMPLNSEPGTICEYSCLGFILLYWVLCRTENLVDEAGFPDGPRALRRSSEILGREDVGFCPVNPGECAPTQVDLQGLPRDENARFLGGISGNAGLFGTVEAVASYCQMVSQQVRDAEPIRCQWIAAQPPLLVRGLGYEWPSGANPAAGHQCGPRTFGHNGHAGGCLWIDPDRDVFGVLLTNRVYPDVNNVKIADVRSNFYDASFVAFSPS